LSDGTRNYQVSVIGIIYDDIVVTPWPHVGRSDEKMWDELNY